MISNCSKGRSEVSPRPPFSALLTGHSFYLPLTPIGVNPVRTFGPAPRPPFTMCSCLIRRLAGIVALCSTGQRGGNVIPGVAIATAIMLLAITSSAVATGNWIYAAGAFYLYLINSIFISLATFIGVNIFDFKKKVFVDKQREKRVNTSSSPSLY